MVEHGNRMLDRRSHIAALASALRVSESDLVGGPHLNGDRLHSDPHMAIPLRVALQTNTLTSPAVDQAHPLLDLLFRHRMPHSGRRRRSLLFQLPSGKGPGSRTRDYIRGLAT